MDKSSHQFGINPVARVTAMSAVANIGSSIQSLESRASHLAQQQAALTAQLAATTSGDGLKKLVSTAEVSAIAQLINQSLTKAEADGVAGKYIAPTLLTQTPTLPKVVSQQLKTAINQSGLFYESHLHEFVEGHRSLAELKQEPQNKLHYMAQSLLPQQLHVLEHQRLSWHGEVWPNQQMNWDIVVQNQQSKQSKTDANEDEQVPIASDLTLHLPHLGKVTANISLRDGRMRIAFLAEQENALQLLKEKSTALSNAIESNGLRLESLTLNRDNTVIEVESHE